MRKLRLDLTDLRVKTFAVIPSADDGRGTVLARSAYSYENITCRNTEFDCRPPSLQTFGCSEYCEHGPDWSRDCPEQMG
jgi:hypothetical protein